MDVMGESICHRDTCKHEACRRDERCHGIVFREEYAADHVLRMAKAIIADAEKYGVVLTIETVPLAPLAMGNHVMVASVRPARDPAQPILRGSWVE